MRSLKPIRILVSGIALLLLLAVVTLSGSTAASGQTDSPPPTPTPQSEPDPEQPTPTPTPELDERAVQEPMPLDRDQIEGPETLVDSLGSYGEEGPINREDLRPGLADYVSDEALDAAQSPDLAPARAKWNGAPVDFVDPVDYQLAFRAQNDYMAIDLPHISTVLERRPDNIGIQGLGLYLDDAEAAEYQRRQDLGDPNPFDRRVHYRCELSNRGRRRLAEIHTKLWWSLAGPKR